MEEVFYGCNFLSVDVNNVADILESEELKCDACQVLSLDCLADLLQLYQHRGAAREEQAFQFTDFQDPNVQGDVQVCAFQHGKLWPQVSEAYAAL